MGIVRGHILNQWRQVSPYEVRTDIVYYDADETVPSHIPLDAFVSRADCLYHKIESHGAFGTHVIKSDVAILYLANDFVIMVDFWNIGAYAGRNSRIQIINGLHPNTFKNSDEAKRVAWAIYERIL